MKAKVVGQHLGQELVEIRARRERDRLTKESHVLRGVLDLLTAEGLVHYRLNSGEVTVDGRRVRLCPEGTPDVLMLWPRQRVLEVRDAQGGCDIWRSGSLYGYPVYLELKRPLSGRLRVSQIREHARLQAAGAVVLVIDDVSQVQELLRGPK